MPAGHFDERRNRSHFPDDFSSQFWEEFVEGKNTDDALGATSCSWITIIPGEV